MAYLQQVTSIPDCNRFTYSAWIRIPAAAEPIPPGTSYLSLFRFGGITEYGNLRYVSNVGLYSSIGLITADIGLYALLCGPVLGGTTFFKRINHSTTSSDGGPQRKFTFGNWHHAIIAVDVSGGFVVDPPTLYPFRIYLDGVSSGSSGNSVIGFITSGPGYDVSSGVHDSGNFLVSNSIFMPHPGSFESSDRFKNTYSTNIEFADVQIWFGTFIDPINSVNFAKFVQIREGKGYPVDPSIAASAFGTQTVLFRGKASDASFWVNRGTGGAFSKVGTISDFTPAPSYG